MRYAAKLWFVLLLTVAFGATGLLLAQQTKIKEVPMHKTPSASGEQMYEAYCAACHGKTGLGDGPAAAALKEPPRSLRTLSKDNGGKFPMDRVVAALNFGTPVAAHGTSAMPIWGPLFGSLHTGELRTHTAQAKMRVANVAHYIETLQDK